MRTAYKILAALSALTVSSIANADCWYQDPNYTFETAYIGAFGGGGEISNRVQMVLPAYGVNDSTTMSNDFITGGIQLGIATAVDRWYIGMEGNTMPTFINSSETWHISGFPFNSEVKLLNFANFDALPGFYITNNAIIYLRAGVGVARLELDQSGPFAKSYDLDDTTYGPQGGVGFDIGLCSNLSIGADYTYTRYTQSSFQETDPVTSNTYTFKAKSTENLVGLHLRYNFLV